MSFDRVSISGPILQMTDFYGILKYLYTLQLTEVGVPGRFGIDVLSVVGWAYNTERDTVIIRHHHCSDNTVSDTTEMINYATHAHVQVRAIERILFNIQVL